MCGHILLPFKKKGETEQKRTEIEKWEIYFWEQP